MSYNPKRYPFKFTTSNQTAFGQVESETTYEGFATRYEGVGGEPDEWDVEAYVTGFAQYQDGKEVSSVTGLKSLDWKVENLEEFEGRCVSVAVFQHQLLELKQAA